MPDQPKEFYVSPNGDRWFLDRDEETKAAHVVNRAEAPFGAMINRFELGGFLCQGRRSPEQTALLQLIGTLVADKTKATAA